MAFEYFNLYDLFVNHVFGSIVAAGIGIAIVLYVLCAILKMSAELAIAIPILFLASYLMATGWGPFVFIMYTGIILILLGSIWNRYKELNRT